MWWTQNHNALLMPLLNLHVLANINENLVHWQSQAVTVLPPYLKKARQIPGATWLRCLVVWDWRFWQSWMHWTSLRPMLWSIGFLWLTWCGQIWCFWFFHFLGLRKDIKEKVFLFFLGWLGPTWMTEASATPPLAFHSWLDKLEKRFLKADKLPNLNCCLLKLNHQISWRKRDYFPSNAIGSWLVYMRKVTYHAAWNMSYIQIRHIHIAAEMSTRFVLTQSHAAFLLRVSHPWHFVPMSQSLSRPAGAEVCRFEIGQRPVEYRQIRPAPPKKPPVFPRAPRHDRLRGGNVKGVLARDGLRELIHGSDPKLGRWSHHKGLFTELIQATEESSIAGLISTLSEARTLGAQNWPECAKANERLKVLEGIRQEMEAASEWVGIEDIENLMKRAGAAGVIYMQNEKTLIREQNPVKTIDRPLDPAPSAAVHPEFRTLALTLARHCCKLRALRDDLRNAAKSADIQFISNTLSAAKELGADWQELELAEAGS